MSTKKVPVTNAKPSPPRCPACRDGVTTQAGIMPYKRPYLLDCPTHLALWEAMDEKETAKEKAEEKKNKKGRK